MFKMGNKKGGILQALNPANWGKEIVKEGGQQVTNIVDEATYSGEESAEQTTRRHKADMDSDNLYSQSVRPSAYYSFFILIICTIIWDLKLTQWQVDLITNSFYLILGWYFGERGVRKIIREYYKAKAQ